MFQHKDTFKSLASLEQVHRIEIPTAFEIQDKSNGPNCPSCWTLRMESYQDSSHSSSAFSQTDAQRFLAASSSSLRKRVFKAYPLVLRGIFSYFSMFSAAIKECQPHSPSGGTLMERYLIFSYCLLQRLESSTLLVFS